MVLAKVRGVSLPVGLRRSSDLNHNIGKEKYSDSCPREEISSEKLLISSVWQAAACVALHK